MGHDDIFEMDSSTEFSPGKTLCGYVSKGGVLCLSNPGQLKLLQEMKERNASLRTSVRGFSMHPFIRDGDVLTISPFNDQQIKIGDIVAFSHPDHGSLIIHRIIRQEKNGRLIKGDNCLEVDGIISNDRIIGRVVKIERKKKKVPFGLGFERKWIAFLNRGKGLYLIKKIWHLPRSAVAFILRRNQDE